MREKQSIVILISLCLLLLITALFSACTQSKAPAQMASPAQTTAPVQKASVIELNCNSQYNVAQLPGKAMQYWADQINKRSNGSIHITVFAGGTLSTTPKIYESVVSGIADIGNQSPSQAPGMFPILAAGDLPLPFKSAWVSSHMTDDLLTHFAPMAEFKEVKVLFGTDCGPFVWGTLKKGTLMRTPADAKGLKIATGGDIADRMVKAFGGTPLSFAPPDLYDACSKGVVDAMYLPIEMQQGWQLADVTYGITMAPLRSAGDNAQIMNLKKWNSLPDSAKKVFDDSAKDAAEWFAKAWWYGDIKSIEHFKSKEGRQLVTMSATDTGADAWVKPLQPIVDDFVAELTKKGLPGADVIKFLNDDIARLNASQPAEKDCIDWVEANLLK